MRLHIAQLLPVLVLAAAQPGAALSARDIYDADAAAVARRDGASVHARSPRDLAGGHSGMKKIRRRKRSTCATASAATASSVMATSSTDASSVAPSSTASSAADIGVAAYATSASSSASSASVAASSAAASASSASVAAPSAASSTSSAAAAASSTSAASTGGLLSELFPWGYGEDYWSTSTSDSSPLSFTGALKPLTAGILPSTATAPDGSTALVANFPAGTYDYSSSTGAGFSFYTEGAHNSVNVEGAKEVMLSYSVFFPDGYQFVKGGKLPGLYGGTSLAEAKSCSGGRQTGRDQCFSARMMWRTDGAGEFYNYFPTSVTQAGNYCSTPPLSVCDPVYGDSIGRGSFTFATGKWTTVAQRLKLNDVGQANGEQELYVDGVQVISLTDLQISVEQDTKIYGIFAQTFYGGHDATWAPTADMHSYFKDWSLAVLA